MKVVWTGAGFEKPAWWREWLGVRITPATGAPRRASPPAAAPAPIVDGGLVEQALMSRPAIQAFWRPVPGKGAS